LKPHLCTAWLVRVVLAFVVAWQDVLRPQVSPVKLDDSLKLEVVMFFS
jgi:hypothetical protein